MARFVEGQAKSEALTPISAAIPFPEYGSLRVLDVGCGPEDAGRVIYSQFPGARIEFRGLERERTTRSWSRRVEPPNPGPETTEISQSVDFSIHVSGASTA